MPDPTKTAAVLRGPTTTRLDELRSSVLSPREVQVLRRVAWGSTNKEIASCLSLSVKTIEAHKANAMRKLGMTRRADIVRYALQQHWFDVDIAVSP